MQDFGSDALEKAIQTIKELSLAPAVLNNTELVQLADIADRINDLRERYLDRRISEIVETILKSGAKQC